MEWSDERTAAVVVCVLLVVAVLSRVLTGRTRTGSRETQAKAVDLMRQSLRWHAMSMQDTNPVFGMRHSNYATAYLEAARHLLSDEAIQRTVHKNVHVLKQNITKQQEHMVGLLGKQCPKILPKGTTISSWIE